MKKILLILTYVLISVSMFSQTVYTIDQGGTRNSCNVYLYDNGNSGAAYGNNRNDVITICSNNPSLPNVRANFNSFDVPDVNDILTIYDGNSVASTLLGSYTGILSPFSVQSTITNTTGCLTFKFVSNATSTGQGFWASTVCIPQCQQILSALNYAECVPTPHVEGSVTYMDICYGDTITFAAGPQFPENPPIGAYIQDTTTCTYLWDFGDGTTSTDRVVHKVYSAIRGYDISLTVKDQRNCTNTNVLGLRVRISRNPYGAVRPLPTICSGTEILVNVGIDNSNVIQINSFESSQTSSERFDSTMFIPDGPNCPIQCYNTFVTFNSFAPGQTITSANDILSICVGMEHSFAGDLGFRIICPNNRSVTLDPNTHSGGSYLGTPNGGANHGNFDNGCLPANNPPGVGAPYCWSEYYNPPATRTFDWLSSNGGTTIPITDTINHTSSTYIRPNNPLSGLIGCPLNGTWNIEICDDYGIDNGYIFWWTLSLDPRLLPVGWSYDVGIDDIVWNGNFVNEINDSTINLEPTTGGTYNYTVTLIDVFGCEYDTTFVLNVVSQPFVTLGPDDTICSGGAVTLNAGGPFGSYLWSTGANTQTIDINNQANYWVRVSNTSNGLTCFSADTAYLKVTPTPTADFYSDITSGCEPITIRFIDNSIPGNVEGHANTFFWDFGDGTSSTQQNPIHVYDHYGDYNVTLTVTTIYGCTHTITKTNYINVFKQPDAVFTTTPANSVITIREPIITFNNQTNNGDSYFWIYGDGHTSTETSPVYDGYSNSLINLPPPNNENATFDVTLISYSSDGCVDTAHVQIRIVNDLLITPNVITPNGDGVNETFEIKHLAGYVSNNIKIYNRWGKKIFEMSGYDNSWGLDASDGTYYFVLECKGYIKDFEISGSITVIGQK